MAEMILTWVLIPGQRSINEDEQLFLGVVEASDGNLNSINKTLIKKRRLRMICPYLD